jgi:hypothetical protein
MSITNSSVLVELHMSVWTANKLDRGATAKVTADNAASSKAAKVHKNLMEGSHLRDKIASLAAECRAQHLRVTLPWNDGGQRLLPTSYFLEYKAKMNDYRTAFDTMVNDFVTEYPALVQTAQNYLGGLFNAEDYPSADEVRSKFSFDLAFSPVPESGDFRLDIPATALAELSQQYEASFNSRMADAMRDPWERMHKALAAITEKLTDKDGEGKKRYHDSLLENVHDLCGLLTHLNVAKDPKLEGARREVESMLAGTSMDLIRESAVARATTKSKVDAILKQFEW